MAELKAGGLAIVIRSDDQFDIGKCVTLKRFVPKEGTALAPNRVIYKMQRANEGSWVVNGDIRICNDNGETELHGWAMFQPHELMPIDGEDFSHEGERQKELTHG